MLVHVVPGQAWTEVLLDGGQQLVRGGRWLFKGHQQRGGDLLCSAATNSDPGLPWTSGAAAQWLVHVKD